MQVRSILRTIAVFGVLALGVLPATAAQMKSDLYAGGACCKKKAKPACTSKDKCDPAQNSNKGSESQEKKPSGDTTPANSASDSAKT